MKNAMDIVMWLFLVIVFVAALKNSKGFARDVSAVGGQATQLSSTLTSGPYAT